MNESTQDNDDIKQRLKSIFPDQVTASRIVDIVSQTRSPIGYGRNSNTPYYKARFAKEIKVLIDSSIEVHSVLCFSEKDAEMSKNTLYQKLYQSIKYLRDNLDPDSKYKEWWDTVKLRYITHKQAWELQYLSDTELRSLVATTSFNLVKDNLPVWRRRVDNYLEDINVTKPLVIDGVCLSQQEALNLKRDLASLDGIEFSVSITSIRIIKRL